ncbi:MAG: YraN family protein [Bacillota bacterium]
MDNRTLGAIGENLAENYLKKSGYQILERNFWCYCGEIDLIAKIRNYISFIEVKFCRTPNFMLPQEKITKAKQKTIRKVAQYYLKLNNQQLDFRFDVVLIIEQGSKTSIKLIKNAF